jgi:hypothetical protein
MVNVAAWIHKKIPDPFNPVAHKHTGPISLLRTGLLVLFVGAATGLFLWELITIINR